MENSKIRSFIGIKLENNIKTPILTVQSAFKDLDCKIKFVSADNIHITLKFIGDIELDHLSALNDIIKNICDNYSPIEISLSDVGVFPTPSFPKVLWVGFTDKDKIALNISNQLNDELRSFGIEKENRNFTPHITIGYIKSLKNKQKIIETIKGIPKFSESANYNINNITLFKSTLTKTGPIYEVLNSFQLKNNHFS